MCVIGRAAACFIVTITLCHVTTLDNIKTVLTETGWDSFDCIYLAQDRDKCRAVVNTVMNLRVP
jgi:hypothetical protein